MKDSMLALVLSACGPLGPPRGDAGAGGGGGTFLPLGGGAGSTGGGVGSTGGGETGGGSSTGGGAATGGGGMTTTGGGTATTGGGSGVDAGLAPLTWSNMAISGATSTSYVIGLSGEKNNLWAVQDTGHLFRSTTGGFVHQFSFPYGAHDVYASGNLVVLLQTRAIRTCITDCTQLANFAQFDLLNSGANLNLFGETLCGQGTSRVVAIVSDTDNDAQVMEWNGSTWTRTASDIGVRYPRGCWFDEQDRLWVIGQDAVVFDDGGAFTPIPLSSNFTTYTAGVSFAGTQWLAGQYGYVASVAGTTVTPRNSGGDNILWAAGGLSADEIFFFGYWTGTNAVGNGFKWDGSQLRPVGNLLPSFGSGSTVRVIHKVSDTELYVAGTNGSGPAIVRGRR
ncbi:MAG: hypothetical protein DI536_02550 [Archangium gephyra]|uniref:Uncharacterized protein n=1 Tax=Archangium gephyra TaxID=48 RepID=A0A2W5TSN9_9BACT|nr:MAG: hypothetical protein DI536_02550 [Archangium gephyra]